MKLLRIALIALLVGAVLPAAQTLDIYVVDVEGGKAMVVVSPSGQSMLIDAGFSGFDNRDAKRIVEAAKAAGLKKFDNVLVTHYDLDHVVNIPTVISMFPADKFFDHGENVQKGERNVKMVDAYLALTEGGKRTIVKPGDRIPLEGVDIQVVAAHGVSVSKPLKGGGQANPYCATTSRKVWTRNNEDVSENAMSIALLFEFGRFRMFDPADLTWNKDIEMMCPNNPVGQVDLYMVSNHGTDNANSPAMVHALAPRVAIINNGPKKGGSVEVFNTLKTSPGIEDIWRLHYWVPGGDAANPAPEFMANIEGSPDGKWLKVSAERDGTFTITNGRTGTSKTYKPKK